MTLKGFSLFLTLILLLIFEEFLPSQAKDKSQEPLRHEVTVTVKLIQVYVLDRNGNPVPDLNLNQSDFEVYDNGKTQEDDRNLLCFRIYNK